MHLHYTLNQYNSETDIAVLHIWLPPTPFFLDGIIHRNSLNVGVDGVAKTLKIKERLVKASSLQCECRQLQLLSIEINHINIRTRLHVIAASETSLRGFQYALSVYLNTSLVLSSIIFVVIDSVKDDCITIFVQLMYAFP